MTDWTPLDAELDRWRADGLTLPLWWRDDDAVTVTPQLDRLTGQSRALGIPVHLAVIPAEAQADLAAHVAANPNLLPVVHGWSHANHAPPGQKKAEFGDHRPPEQIARHLRDGLERLTGLFGDRLLAMFVPPWNRTTDAVIAQLPACGYRMISTFQPRQAAHPAPGLTRVNTHLDPINWKAGKGAHDPDLLIAQVAGDLARRRRGQTDAAEPYGLLTHHLVQDDATWRFAGELLARLLDGPARPWTAQDRTDEGDRP